ncbi:MAG: hypothetical protein LBC17_01370 [Lactobacillaceae bacterium]|nr:hypothetical protein [Lactobacillaceae bacterium]
MSLNLTDKDQIYEFIIKNSEKIQELDRQQKETFLSKVRDINRYFKISFNKITKETKEYISIINITKQVALQREISCDDKLDISKKQLKQLIEEAFKNSTTNISVISKTFKKDITTVTDILRETDQLKDLSKSAAVEYIKN